MILCKLKLGCSNKDLAYRFCTSESTVSTVIRSIIPDMARRLSSLILWPDRSVLRKRVPKRFRRNYRNAVCIIDCMEIFMCRPTRTNARVATYSNYKHTNTIKFLVACILDGLICYISEAWGGRVSDVKLTKESSFLNHLQPRDVVLADRGFMLKEIFASYGVKLVVPSFTKGKSQLFGLEVEKSRSIANVRIHIERVSGRIRSYNILNTDIPVNQVDLVEKYMTIVCALTNLKNSVVSALNYLDYIVCSYMYFNMDKFYFFVEYSYIQL